MRFQCLFYSGASCLRVAYMVLFLCLRISSADVSKPLDLQEAPGIGLSLSPDHGCVSLHFDNGSSMKVGTIHGTPNYMAAMKYMSMGPCPSPREPLQEKKLNLPDDILGLGMSWLYSFLPQFLYPRPAEHPWILSPALEPIADMMRALFDTASTMYHLKHRTAYISVPAFLVSSDPTFGQRLALLSRLGLEGFYSRFVSQSHTVLRALYQLEDCFGIPVNITHEIPDLECEKYNGRPVHTLLSLQLESDYFGLCQMNRDDGVFIFSDNQTEVHFDHGTNSMGNFHGPDGYWNWIKDRVSHYSQYKGDPIDLLLLHGTEVTRPDFLNLIREVFAHNDKIREEDYLRSAEEHAYAASKGAAEYAKLAMGDDPY